MPSGTVTISRYSVDVISNVGPTSARIYLYRSNNSLAAMLSFYPPENMPRDNDAAPNFPASGFARVNYPITSFAAAVDVLRNEKPIYFTWNALERPYGFITTSNEPVGEEEGT